MDMEFMARQISETDHSLEDRDLESLSSDSDGSLVANKFTVGAMKRDQERAPDCRTVLKGFIMGTWFGVKGRANKETVVHQWTNNSIICGLCASISANGLFAELPGHGIHEAYSLETAYLVVWCFATLAMVTAAVGYVFQIIGVTETGSQAEFTTLVKNMGWWIRTPLWTAISAAVALYVGIILYIIKKCGRESAFVCIVACGVSLFLPLFGNMFYLVWSVQATRHESTLVTKHKECSPDAVYEALRTYYLETCKGSLYRLCRHDFLHGYNSHGEVMQKLAAKIYDSWLEKKLDKLIREDPGF